MWATWIAGLSPSYTLRWDYLILILISHILLKLFVSANSSLLHLGVLRQPGGVVGANGDGSEEVPGVDGHGCGCVEILGGN